MLRRHRTKVEGAASYVTVCQSVLCADNTTAANCRSLCTLSPTTNCNSATIVVNGTFN